MFLFQNEVLKLKSKQYVNHEIIKAFINRINSSQGLTQDDNTADHFCVFFLPFIRKNKMIYLGHHIKADDWIPPGGHIKKNEIPIDTVYREFYEELKFKLTTEKVKLFDLSIKHINKPHRKCKIHYDLWYLVFIKKINFEFDKEEFYHARWLTIQKALSRVKNNNDYRDILKKLLYLF